MLEHKIKYRRSGTSGEDYPAPGGRESPPGAVDSSFSQPGATSPANQT